MAQLKNIIFDLGGVLLNIDYKKTEQAFKDLGFDNFKEMYSQFTADELFANLETGKISNDDFYDRLTKEAKVKISRQEITDAWNKMLLTWRRESLAFIAKLNKKYKVYLLSNTNAIHLEAFNEILKNETGRSEGIDDLFAKAYYSHKISLRKPNNDIFNFVAKDADLKPEETLFIDDSKNNIEAAGKLGYKTHLLLPEENIEDLDYTSY
jgi:HAD superfamily hydrolase (TIGR01509 family)